MAKIMTKKRWCNTRSVIMDTLHLFAFESIGFLLLCVQYMRITKKVQFLLPTCDVNRHKYAFNGCELIVFSTFIACLRNIGASETF